MELQIRGVSKTYPNGVHALKDVPLTIPAGMYGLLGLNGAATAAGHRLVLLFPQGAIRAVRAEPVHRQGSGR